MSELKHRNEIVPEFKWNLATIFASDEAWQNSFDELTASLNQIEAYKGRLGESAESLLDGLTLLYELQVDTYRLFLYARLKKDEDTANSFYQGMADSVASLNTKFQAAISFIEPEIIALGQEKISAFMDTNDDLKIYKHFFDNMLRLKNHILSMDNEEILAKAGEIGDASQSIFTMLNNADMVFPNALDSNGLEHGVNHASYSALMEKTDRTLRKNVQGNFIDAYIAQKNTIATAYSFSVKNDLFTAGVRKYDSALDAALSTYNIPKAIYKNLINTVGDNLHIFHRYLDIRKKCLKYDELHMWDMTVPMVENANTHMSWEDAKTIVTDGLAVLGEEYQNLLRKGFSEGWVDVYGNKGKRSGAYSWSTFGFMHPYVLMNYDDTIDDAFTLAHEMGHALHYHYTHATQPVMYSSYSMFLAEVASTVNEALLMNHLLNTTTDKTQYNYLLNYFIQQFVGTFFRQTMLAEFEMLTHEMAEQGKPLTSDTLNKLYRSLLEKHNGTGVVIDEKAGYHWSRIPHFYRTFYVYQYATGFAASMALSKKIRDEGAPAVERYLDLLKSGCKDYSTNLLKNAGVDMTSPEPIKDALKIFEDLLDRFEESVLQ